jgi:prolyl oligopeptidase
MPKVSARRPQRVASHSKSAPAPKKTRASQALPPLPATPTVPIAGDPYRWLEPPSDANPAVMPNQAARTQTWTRAQTERFDAWTKQKPEQLEALRRHFKSVLPGSGSTPADLGVRGSGHWQQADNGYTRKLYVDGKREAEAIADPKLAELLAMLGETGKPGKMLLDTATIAKKLGLDPRETFVQDMVLAPSRKVAALEVTEAKQDARSLVLFDLKSDRLLTDRISGVTGGIDAHHVLWLDEKHFVYPWAGLDDQELRAHAPQKKHLMVHTVGTSQAQDRPLFSDVPADRVAHLRQSGGYYVRDLRRADKPGDVIFERAPADPKKLLAGTLKFSPVTKLEGVEDSQLSGSTLLIQTRAQPNGSITTGRVASADLNHPRAELKTIIPTFRGEELRQLVQAGPLLVGVFEKDLDNLLRVFDAKGRLQETINPTDFGFKPGTLHDVSWDAAKQRLHFMYSRADFSPGGYELDLKTRALKKTGWTDPDGRITVERVQVTSKDGTQVPMQILHKGPIRRDGDSPTLIYAYGGFDEVTTDNTYLPVAFMPILEAGGTVALPAPRGGGEKGDAWHDAGARHNKQNTFDDVTAAARFLIDQGYTRPQRLAVRGGSNGGLMVGALITQHPELWGAAVAQNGAFDMLRFPQFTNGMVWKAEYGDPSKPKDREVLASYSPYHNVRAAKFPATLITTADKDDRVDSSHSFKFAAQLQAHQQGDAPIFLQSAPRSSHLGTVDASVAAKFEAQATLFVMRQIGLDPIAKRPVPIDDGGFSRPAVERSAKAPAPVHAARAASLGFEAK